MWQRADWIVRDIMKGPKSNSNLLRHEVEDPLTKEGRDQENEYISYVLK